MNYEFIIGTLIGVVGLVISYICGKEQINNLVSPNMQHLLNQLASQSHTLDKQKIILRKINLKLKMFGKSIPKEYIDNYKPISKAKTNVLLDILVASNIEPSSEICKSFLGYDSPALRRDWQKAVNAIESDEQTLGKTLTTTDMTSDSTNITPNTVYISSLLKEKFPDAAAELLRILKKHNIRTKELTNTKDIWCRDYMPIQNRMGELIQFNYDPSYLKGEPEWEESRSDVHEVCKANGINPIFSDIRIDGGNVVMHGNKVILTNRIFKENPEYEKDELVAELKHLLKAEVYIIPAYSISEDVTGHADGMVRFVDEKMILGNDLTDDYDYINKGIAKMCKEAALKYIDVPYFVPEKDPKHEMNAIGIYVNYLEVGNLIVLPVFGVKGNKDKEVLELFRKLFPDRIIETINYNEVAQEGGLLNCTTWTIME